MVREQNVSFSAVEPLHPGDETTWLPDPEAFRGRQVNFTHQNPSAVCRGCVVVC